VLLRDNRSAELSAWDLEALSAMLKEIAEEADDPLRAIEELGWSKFEADPLLAAVFETVHTEDGDTEFVPMHHLPVTEAQYQVFLRALEKVRHDAGDEKLSVGRAIELICADYLAGA
jgi:hypothetical protein